jgi:hypothetical protein
MAYYVKRYLDGSRCIIRVRDGISDAIRGLLEKFKPILGRVISFCVSRLQGTYLERRIASLLQKSLDRLNGSAKEATAAENGGGDLGAARQNLLETLKLLRKAKEEAEKSNYTSDVQIGIKAPLEAATKLIEPVAKVFSIKQELSRPDLLRRLGQYQSVEANGIRTMMGQTNARKPLALTYDPRVIPPIVPGNIPAKLSKPNPIKAFVLKQIGQIPTNGADGIRQVVMNAALRAINSNDISGAASTIKGIASSEISKLKNSLGNTNRLHLPENERKSFNSKINSVNKYAESVIGVLRRISGQSGNVIPAGDRLFEKKIIYVPPKNSQYGYPWNQVRQKPLPF